jgi:hypothetical protein
MTIKIERINEILGLLESLLDIDDPALRVHLQMAHDRATILWAQNERAHRAEAQRAEDEYWDAEEEAYNRHRNTGDPNIPF